MTDSDNTETTTQLVDGSYGLTRFNALRHGVLSKYVLLPWEDPEEYRNILDALVAEHAPRGPTEEHLVEELAGVIWRKRRLRLGENAAHQQALASHANAETAKAALIHVAPEIKNASVTDALIASEEKTTTDRKRIAREVSAIREALRLLEPKSETSYPQAVAALADTIQSMWDDISADTRRGWGEDAESLERFLRDVALPWCEQRQREYDYRPLIRAQALAIAVSPVRLEGLARYEVHLDRKLERVLTMLFKLQDLRGAGKTYQVPP
jgi:hypothetical protein